MKKKDINLFLTMVLVVYYANLQPCIGQYGSYEPLRAITPSLPPSPTVAEFAKYGAWPVSHYRGTPDISIPLTNFSVADYSLPISLSYHASGIRVDDIASWVGLGWSLNAGGVISVSVNGAPDFGHIVLPPEEPADRLRIRSRQDIADLDFFTEAEFISIKGGAHDVEPDIYNFSFNGYSGQFVIDNNHNVHFLTNHSGISITVNIPGKSITARDQYGRRYIFNELEFTENRLYYRSYNAQHNTSSGSGFQIGIDQKHISAFYLSEIILENNKGSIFFEYDDESSTYFTALSGTMSTTSLSGDNPCNANNTPLYWHENAPYTFSYSRISHGSKRLRKITNNRNSAFIQFETNHTREDISGTRAMSRMSVFHPGSTEANFYWDFSYDYFLSPGTAKSDIFGNQLHKRLRLSNIQKKTATLSDPPYRFDYYGDNSTNEADLRLPYRTSFDGKDHWGYNNADARIIQPENFSKIFPSVTSDDVKPFRFISAHMMYYGNLNPIMEMNLNVSMPAFNGGNKTPNGHFAKAFTLKRIEYHTGGSSIFDFEGHVYSAVNNQTFGPKPCGGLRIRSITDQPENSDPITRNFTYGQGVINQEPVLARAIPKACYNPNIGEVKCYLGIIVGPGVGQFPDYNEAFLWGYRLSSNPVDPIYSYNSDYIGYNMVTESITGGGSTRYHYRTANSVDFANRYSFQAGSNTFYVNSMVKVTAYVHYNQPVYPFTNQLTGPLYARGQLLRMELLDANGNKAYEEQYEYNNIAGSIVYGNKVYQQNLPWECYIPIYHLAAYEIHTGKSFLERKQTNTFFGNDTLKEVVLFDYYQDYELIRSVATTNSKGENMKTQYTYPFSYPDETSQESMGNRTPIHQALRQMTQRHMHGYPIERLFSVNNSWKDGDLRLYRLEDNQAVLMADYNYKLGTPQTASTAFNGRIENPNYFHRVFNYDIFDNRGNMLQYRKENDINNAVIWAYNQTLPIAKVENSTQDRIAYSSFEDLSGSHGRGGWYYDFRRGTHTEDDSFTGIKSYQGSSISKSGLPSGTYIVSYWARKSGSGNGSVTVNGSSQSITTNQWVYKEVELANITSVNISLSGVFLDELRLYPKGAFMTTYTHDPLIGITSETDVRGLTTRYEYDVLGRLIKIRDHEGKIINQFEYNYAQ